MSGFLQRAWGYQGDAMNLPVANVTASVPFYETILGFQVVSRGEAPPRSAVLARDEVQIRLVENGGDPSQDGCAFHVRDLEALFAEFKSNGLQKDLPHFDVEQHDDAAWMVFYVVAPDGLCYWFGEKQPRGDAA
jgi:catechol 2,3-dioxygenase-like lactoylglutathione lyase family enzyme